MAANPFLLWTCEFPIAEGMVNVHLHGVVDPAPQVVLTVKEGEEDPQSFCWNPTNGEQEVKAIVGAVLDSVEKFYSMELPDGLRDRLKEQTVSMFRQHGANI